MIKSNNKDVFGDFGDTDIVELHQAVDSLIANPDVPGFICYRVDSSPSITLIEASWSYQSILPKHTALIAGLLREILGRPVMVSAIIPN